MQIRSKMVKIFTILNPMIEATKRKLKKPEYLFGLIAGTVGLILIFLVPPFQVPDEDRHFLRAYQISQGELRQVPVGNSSGVIAPVSFVEIFNIANEENLLKGAGHYDYTKKSRQLLHIKHTNDEQAIGVISPNLAKYSPVAYLPQGIGIFLTQLFTDRPIVMFYAARIFNLLAFIVLAFFAIRLMPKAKFPLLIVGLLPMTLFEASSVAADAVTIGSVMLFTATIYRIYRQDRVGTKLWLVLLLATLLVVLSKYALFVLVIAIGVVLFSPKNKKLPTQELRNRLKWIGVILTVSIILFGLWTIYNGSTSDNLHDLQVNGNIFVEPKRQLDIIINQPLHYLKIFTDTLLSTNSNDYITSFLGLFGWLNVPMPLWSMLVLATVVFLSFGLKADKGFALKLKPSILVCIGVVVCLIGLLTAMFITWTPVGSKVIEGFQGRYLIPFITLLVPVLIGRYSHTIRTKTILLTHLLVLVVMLVTIFSRYYYGNPT